MDYTEPQGGLAVVLRLGLESGAERAPWLAGEGLISQLYVEPPQGE